MKRIAILSAFCLLFCFLSPSCKKPDSIYENYTQESSVGFARQWYQQQPNRKEARWSETIIAKDKSRLLVPLNWTANLDGNAKALRILVVHLNEAEKPITTEIVEIIPNNNYWNNYGTQFEKEKYSGTLVLYDQDLKFKYAQYFEDGKFKYPAVFQKIQREI